MKRSAFVVVMCIALGMAGAWADSPGTPGPSRYTLSDIYEYLNNGTTATIVGHTLEPPSEAVPGDTRYNTLNQIYDDIKAKFDQCDATPSKVLDGTKFFSTQPGSWGVRTGTYVTPTPAVTPTPTIAILKDAGVHLGGVVGTTVTFTNAMTIANNPGRLLLVVMDGSGGPNDLVSQVTWNGQPMIKIFSVRKPNNRWDSYWYLLAPGAGTYDLVVTNVSSDYVEPSMVCYYNVKQVAPEAVASNSGTSAIGGYGTNIRGLDGQSGYNIALVDRTDNPQGAPGNYDISSYGDAQKATVTTLTSGAFVTGFLGSGGGSWTAGAISILSNQ
jgi:hypothetical protein